MHARTELCSPSQEETFQREHLECSQGREATISQFPALSCGAAGHFGCENWP